MKGVESLKNMFCAFPAIQGYLWTFDCRAMGSLPINYRELGCKYIYVFA
jgi:hypothetical protein